MLKRGEMDSIPDIVVEVTTKTPKYNIGDEVAFKKKFFSNGNHKANYHIGKGVVHSIRQKNDTIYYGIMSGRVKIRCDENNVSKDLNAFGENK